MAQVTLNFDKSEGRPTELFTETLPIFGIPNKDIRMPVWKWGSRATAIALCTQERDFHWYRQGDEIIVEM